MFCGLMLLSLPAGRGAPTGLPVLGTLLTIYILAGSMALWAVVDASRSRRSVPYDFGSLVFFTWPVSIPIYLFSTRGWRGFIPVGWFVLLWFAAAVVDSVGLVLLARH